MTFTENTIHFVDIIYYFIIIKIFYCKTLLFCLALLPTVMFILENKQDSFDANLENRLLFVGFRDALHGSEETNWLLNVLDNFDSLVIIDFCQ